MLKFISSEKIASYKKKSKSKNKSRKNESKYSFHYDQIENIIFTTNKITAEAEITQIKPIIHHFTTSFAFLIFSSSPVLRVISKPPYTIDHTEKIHRNIARACVQVLIFSLSHTSTLASSQLAKALHFKQLSIPSDILTVSESQSCQLQSKVSVPSAAKTSNQEKQNILMNKTINIFLK
jgi:hypothetical protein